MDINQTELIDVSVIVPVLDEEGTVIELSHRVLAVLDSLELEGEIIFVDDGSRDETCPRIAECHLKDSRVKLVELRRNFGKAAALTAGFDVCRGRLVVTMDGDLQDVPEEIPRMIEALDSGDLDLVSGWKKDRKDPISKRWPSKLFNTVTGYLASVPLHDFNCGFKVYRREVLEQVAIYGELHRYIPVLAARRGFRVGELAVLHEPRKSGISKYGFDRFYKGLLDLITVLFITRYTRRPLHLFGSAGLLLLGSGTVINGYLAFIWLFYQEGIGRRPLLLLGVLLMVLGFQILTTGLIGEMITLKNFRRRDSYSVRRNLL